MPLGLGNALFGMYYTAKGGKQEWGKCLYMYLHVDGGILCKWEYYTGLTIPCIHVNAEKKIILIARGNYTSFDEK